MKENKILENSNFYHKGADQLLKTEIPRIENEITTFSMDLAEQSRPTKEDSSALFLPKIESMYQVLLELVFKMIGAISVLHQTADQISEIYDREEKGLHKNLNNFKEKARVLRKDLKALNRSYLHVYRDYNVTVK